MERKSRLYILLYIIILLIKFIHAIEEDEFELESKYDLSNEDKYYMIFMDNGNSENSKEKRQEADVLINLMVDEIHSLIIENKDTYEDIEKYEEIEEEENMRKKKKRNEEEEEKEEEDSHYAMDYGETDFVYPVSTVGNSTVLYAYLSSDLVDKVKQMKNINNLTPDRFVKLATNYDVNEIKTETKWKNVGVRENAPLHLSLISQGKYFKEQIEHYDTNYYYPLTDGKDIDMVFIDSGFNFRHPEFSNTDERTVKCVVKVSNGKVETISDESFCGTTDRYSDYHGEMVADTAAGIEKGVASKANIYSVALKVWFGDIKEIDIFAGLQYISENLIRENKTVVNISFGNYYSISNESESINHYEKLINEINEKKGIVVTAAGNNGLPAYDENSGNAYFPCSFDHVICVSGVKGINGIDNDTYERAADSNYGKSVNIYAPYVVDVLYQNSKGKNLEANPEGTSFSSPIVAGVVATLMSENPDIQFTTQSMLEYLTKLGNKNIISGIEHGPENLFINNGKRIIYSQNEPTTQEPNPKEPTETTSSTEPTTKDTTPTSSSKTTSKKTTTVKKTTTKKTTTKKATSKITATKKTTTTNKATTNKKTTAKKTTTKKQTTSKKATTKKQTTSKKTTTKKQTTSKKTSKKASTTKKNSTTKKTVTVKKTTVKKTSPKTATTKLFITTSINF